MPITSPNEYRAKHHKEVTLPSGAVFLIRKLTQRDYFPKGLMALATAEDGLSKDRAAAWLADHLQELTDMETDMIVKGVVLPRITSTQAEADGDTGKLFVGDLDPRDRAAVLVALNEWSGLLPTQQSAVDTFREPVGTAVGSDGQVLQPDAGSTPGSPA